MSTKGVSSRGQKTVILSDVRREESTNIDLVRLRCRLKLGLLPMCRGEVRIQQWAPDLK